MEYLRVTSLNTVPAQNALLSVRDQWIYVIGFDSSIQRYQGTIMNVPESNANVLYPGYGYWIYMSEEEILPLSAYKENVSPIFVQYERKNHENRITVNGSDVPPACALPCRRGDR